MLIQTNSRRDIAKAPARPATQPAPTENAETSAPTETFTPGGAAQPKKPYEPWVPLANAGVVAGLVGIPSAIGAIGASTLGQVATGVLLPLTAAAGAGYLAYRSAKKETYHPVIIGMSTLAAGGIAGMVSPFLAFPGASWGFKGALIAAGVAGGLAGVVSAFGIHHENKKIAAFNASLPKS